MKMEMTSMRMVMSRRMSQTSIALTMLYLLQRVAPGLQLVLADSAVRVAEVVVAVGDVVRVLVRDLVLLLRVAVTVSKSCL